jgi:dihydroorotase
MVPPVRRRSDRDAPARSRESPAWILAGRAYVRGRLQPAEIAIGEDGRIQSVGRHRTGARRHDVGDAVILPAATDLHVHFREPGASPRVESLASGTVEAALGGVTLVGEMPNTQPPVTDTERLAEKSALVMGRSAVDVLLYASPSVPRALEGLARAAGAFKLYLSPTTGVDEPPAPGSIPALLETLNRLRLPVSVHAEDPRGFREGPPATNAHGWDAARPIDAELRAIDLLVDRPLGLRLHVAHVTSERSVKRLREAHLSFEATPHHLLLSTERARSDPRFKVNPPLRTEIERAALWQAFCRGDVPILASDHAPHPPESKSGEFGRAPSGMPGVETMLPLLLAKVRAAELSLPVLLAAACDRPARWFGQPLGRIAVGHRANLVVVDFKARTEVDARRLHAPCGYTAFEGWEAIFPREHYRDGRPIVRDGEFVGSRDGRIVRPEFAEGIAPIESGEDAGA